MARWPRSVSTPAKWFSGVLVVSLAIATGVLVFLAVDRAAPPSAGGTADPIPTFSYGRPAATSTATPTPDAAAPVDIARESERFLSAGSGGMWRASAGVCGGVAPVIERSTDGGATWTTVTPTYRGIAQVLSLDSFAGTQAEAVAAMGPTCEVQALRTFTQGEFWAPYPAVLATSRYPTTADPAVIVTPAGPVTAPCADPRSFRASGSAVALVCDGTAYALSASGSWDALAPADAVAVAIDGADVLVASAQTGCAGIAITRVASGAQAPAQEAGCLEGADPASALAIAAVGEQVVAWSGDAVLRYPS